MLVPEQPIPFPILCNSDQVQFLILIDNDNDTEQ